jgi:hypothetical protein
VGEPVGGKVIDVAVWQLWQQMGVYWPWLILPVAGAWLGWLVWVNGVRISLGRWSGVMAVGQLLVSGLVLVTGWLASGLWVEQEIVAIVRDDVRGLVQRINQSNDLVGEFGIVTDTEDLLKRLNELDGVPEILGQSDQLQEMMVSMLLSEELSRSGFYDQVLVPEVLGMTVVELKPIAEVYWLPNDTLVVASLNETVIEAITPTLGRKLVEQYFGSVKTQPNLLPSTDSGQALSKEGEREDSYTVKPEPAFALLTREEYSALRELQIDEYLLELRQIRDQIRRVISEAPGVIGNMQLQLAAAVEIVEQMEQGRDSWYGECVQMVSDQSFCDDEKAKIDEVITANNQVISAGADDVQDFQVVVAGYRRDQQMVEAVISQVEQSKLGVNQELGIFFPPNDVKVVLESSDHEALAGYMAIVVHEYLHYISFISEDRTLPRLFEEGLTEYLARQVVALQWEGDVGQGYSSLMPVIFQLAEDVPEEELVEIYFTKDTERLEAVLAGTYGAGFYDRFQHLFQVATYMSDEAVEELVEAVVATMEDSRAVGYVSNHELRITNHES